MEFRFASTLQSAFLGSGLSILENIDADGKHSRYQLHHFRF